MNKLFLPILLLTAAVISAQAPGQFDSPPGCFINPLVNTEAQGLVNLIGPCGPATADDYIGVRDGDGFFIGSDALITAGSFSLNIADEGADNGGSCVALGYGLNSGLENVTLILWDASDNRFYVGTNTTFLGVKAMNGLLTGFDGDENMIDTYNFECSMEVLPVTLAGFKARATQDGRVKIEWSTLDETNNDRFEVQRSFDGRNYETIGIVRGSGTVTVFNNYEFMDDAPKTGNNIYRLKQVDYDGTFEYSPIALVEISGKGAPGGVQVFPNPITASTATFALTGSWGTNIDGQLLDFSGRTVANFSGLQTGSTTVDLPALPAGVYQLLVSDQVQREVIRVVIR